MTTLRGDFGGILGHNLGNNDIMTYIHSYIQEVF